MPAPSPAPHKPRRKANKAENDGDKPRKFDALVRTPAFPLAAFMWPARTSLSQWEVLPLVLMVVGLFRWAAGLWGYSGFQRPPLFGDYEAQRHWMEITANLPISQWYFHDLEWWGLDYPPLTAYHSWALGKIGSLINPKWFALMSSRGSHDPMLKIFMRATVIASEYLIFVPAATVFVRRFSRLNGVNTWTSNLALVAILMQPSLILIDHVHFQYNTVMLGFVVASMSSMLAERYKWAAVFFVAALGFKQMALYYAFSVFSYLLGRCITTGINPSRLFGIALVTLISFGVLVLPLALGVLYDKHRGIEARPELNGATAPLPIFPFIVNYIDPQNFYYPIVEQLVQMVHRVFPFSRGLFEDKVANFWCALNTVIKLRNFPVELLQKAALGATLLSIIPPNLILFLRPRKSALPVAFAATAWGFFLFSWQVHEKSVLLPLMPMTLLLAGKQGMSGEGAVCSPHPALGVPPGPPPTSWSAPFQEGQSGVVQWGTALLQSTFYVTMAAWHVVEAFVVPPPGKPDLWVVANVGVGAAGFSICYLWCLWRLLRETEFLPSAPKTKSKTQ
ncbi:hypothetical protein TrVFT333_009110 [Trichoderma virens FT-333]|nr:hypothetical protein TrVFT333_009110 [Trichoderma virens FT-333]